MIRRKLFEDIKDVKYYIESQLDSMLAESNLTVIKSKAKIIKINFQDRIK